LARILTGRSTAFICPASHEGILVKLFRHAHLGLGRRYRGQVSSKAELSSAQDLPANLTSGGTASPPRSRIRDRRAPGERHHSVRRPLRARPDNGDAPLDPGARAAPQPRPISGQSGRGLHDRPLRQHALGCEPPQSDQEPPCQSHDHHLAHAPSGAADALAEPAYLSGPRLIALP
jgi:hypothetical protein